MGACASSAHSIVKCDASQEILENNVSTDATVDEKLGIELVAVVRVCSEMTLTTGCYFDGRSELHEVEAMVSVLTTSALLRFFNVSK